VNSKPGRNEPCPCGSGKKYKRCCGQELAARPAQAALHPNEVAALVALVNQGRFYEAEQRARVLVDAHPHVGMLWKILSVALLRQGKDALPALRQTTLLMPDDAEAHGNLGSALHDQGQWQEALMSLRRALEIEPHDVGALIDAANAARAIGGTREAVGLYQRALAINPRLLEAHNDLGNTLLELGQHEGAVDCYRRALDIDPDDARVHSNLANALRQLKRPDEAIASCHRAIALDPTIDEPHNTLGRALSALGRLEEAVASYRQALTLNARYVEALDNLGNALRDLGELQQAVMSFRQAVELEPERAATHYNLGNALLDCGWLDQAAESYARALALQPRDGPAHVTLSMVLRRQGRAAEADASCRAALAIQPDSCEALSFLGELCADRGQFAEAEALFQRAIAIDPDFPDPWSGIPTLRKMTRDDTAWLRGTENLVAKRLPLRREIGLRFALGKYFDDVEQYEHAFGHYRQANELTKRYGSHYDDAALTQRVDRIIDDFDSPWMQQCQAHGSDSERPVFIVGMPRSGTTLTEQILASHPGVFGAGELTFWDTAFAAYEAAGMKSGIAGAPAAGTPAAAGLIPRMASAYLDRLTTLTGSALRVVDKMPANFMNVGLIHAAFPRARIIHLRRHPIDTCLSIYFQYFSNTHPYANDLDSLAHYYTEYSRIMDHWRASLPTALLEIPYEALIEDQEGWTRRMLDFVGLPWDPRCLDFHRTNRVVITTSKWQVRQKIHSSSAGRWKNYERHVGPLRRLMNLTSAIDR
jgi:tetratricopeptide (TPR) repeat protein